MSDGMVHCLQERGRSRAAPRWWMGWGSRALLPVESRDYEIAGVVERLEFDRVPRTGGSLPG